MKTWGDGSYARKQIRFESEDHIKDKRRTKTGIPQGNLMLMPHRVAIALQDWGWIVRNDVIWMKRNPMPESQAGWRYERERKEKSRTNEGGLQMSNLASMDAGIDGGKDRVEWEYLEDYELRKGSWRHTRQHEYVFMLTKKMQYFANQEAVRENTSEDSGWAKQRAKGDNKHQHIYGTRWHEGLSSDHVVENHPSGRNPRSVLDVPLSELEKIALYTLEYAPWLIDEMVRDETNPADVLDVPTQPWKHAHYATYPANLIAPLIRATCPRWACPVCGQGWSPVVEKEKGNKWSNPKLDELAKTGMATHGQGKSTIGSPNFDGQGWDKHGTKTNIKEYRPTCEHPHTIEEAIPGTVFDPFVGSGTTVQVAKQLLRRGIGLDISMEYLDEQAKIRTGQGSPSNVLDDLPLFELIDK
jgi:DNA modification methylase